MTRKLALQGLKHSVETLVVLMFALSASKHNEKHLERSMKPPLLRHRSVIESLTCSDIGLSHSLTQQINLADARKTAQLPTNF